jgi:hypothetical protein
MRATPAGSVTLVRITAITGAGDGGTAGTASIDDVTFHRFLAWRVGVSRRQGF